MMIFNKIVSLIMSVLISMTGYVYTSFNGMLDSMSELVFGLPYSTQAIKDGFLNDIGDSNVEKLENDIGYVNDKIIVFLRSDATFFEKLSFFKECGGKAIGWSTPADLYVLNYDEMSYSAIEKKCNILKQNNCVELAVPVMASKYSLDRTPTDDFGMVDTELIWDEIIPEGRNWWLEAIDARQAWDYSEKFDSIKVGIVDSGVDVDHPDLNGKIYFPDSKSESRNHQDTHGTHVAGIIGAYHNDLGIAGIADRTEICSIDWEPDDSQIWLPDVAIYFGLSKAVKAGAKVVNFSVGTSASKSGNYATLAEQIITPCVYSYMMGSLLSKGYDFVVVQSAGNGDENVNPIDASYNGLFSGINEDNVFTGLNNISAQSIVDRIIIVGSAQNDGDGNFTQSSFSNVGERVDIAAPGSSIYSLSTDGGYEYMSGTSMAAPIVTGVASLVWSINPEFSGDKIKEIVINSTDSVAQVNTSTPYIYDVVCKEYPLVNAKLAVEEAIRITYPNYGTVSGSIVGDAAEVRYNGVCHTVFSNGNYSFVAPAGTGEIEAFNAKGESLGKVDITVVEGKTTAADRIIVNHIDFATETDAKK